VFETYFSISEDSRLLVSLNYATTIIKRYNIGSFNVMRDLLTLYF